MLCEICMCEIDDECISCHGDECHFHAACLDDYLLSTIINDDIIKCWEKYECISCPMHKFKCKSYIHEDSFLKTSIVKTYIKTTQKIVSEISAQMTKEIIENQMISKDSTNIEDTIIKKSKDLLTTAISCPNCNTSFYDFNGCLALTCSTCNADFCGFCLKKQYDSDSAHACVASHTSNKNVRSKYGITDRYFVSPSIWEKIKEDIQMNTILDYLGTVKNDIVWASFNALKNTLIEEKLLSLHTIYKLEEKIFSNRGEGHMIRLPNVFWKLLTVNYNITIEDAISKEYLTEDMKKIMGICVVKKIKDKYPNWVPIKTPVPGRNYDAINYPIEFYPLIERSIEEWTKENIRGWTDKDISKYLFIQRVPQRIPFRDPPTD